MNNPQINPDDPKWTAYVLGELDDAQRAEIERLLETSDEARALVDELNLAAMTLKEELAPMASLGLTPEQRSAIHIAVQPAQRRWFGVAPATWGMGLAAAATVVLAAWVGTAPAPLPLPQVAQVLPEATSAAKAQESVETQNAPVSPPAKSSFEAESLEAESKEDADFARKRADSTDPSSEDRAKKDQPVVGNDVTDLVRVLRQEKLEDQTFAGIAAGNGTANVVRDGLSVNDERSVGRGAPAGIMGGIANERAAQTAAVQSRPVTPVVGAAVAPAAGGRGGGRGGGGARGGAPAGAGRGAGVDTASSLTTGTITGDALRDLPDNEKDLLQYLQKLAAERGIVDGNANIRVDGFEAASLPNRTAAGPPPPPPAAPRLPNNSVAPGPNTEAYDRVVDNPFIRATQQNLATFSIDVDTASYANMRRFLTQNQMPPRDSVRIEELINYFSYDYAQPRGNDPIAPNMEVAATPWNPQSRLVRIGIKAREINANRRPPSNLVFLIDVSGSMNTPAKLPLVKAGLKMMVDRLGENDMVSIVVYAGASGLVLRPTSAMRKEVIQQAIDSLQPGGSTNGASGIQLAYNQASANFIRGGTNRVILMTDGDFNVGITNQGDLTRLIEDRARSGVFLSVLGFGMGNIKDSTLEKLADQGNGHYAYIDTINEAHKVLVEEMGSTLVAVAKDVKIQVDFNPARVEAYRLIGYENRVLRTEDFNNDLKDAGDMGAGHTVTALFEVVPKGGYIPGPSIDPSKYTLAPANAEPARIPAGTSNEMLTLRVRYKLPEASTSTRMDVPLVDRGTTFARATADFRFAAAVAEFGMILRDSPYRGNASLDSVLDLAEGSRGQDRNGYRQEFIQLVQRAKRLR